MELKIITPTSRQALKINWLELNTPVGNIIIQSGHAPTIFTLEKGKAVIYERPDGKQESFIIQDAVVKIDRVSATVIINR